MDTSQQQVIVTSREKEISAAGQRRHRSIAEKRRIVEETLAEGASVARIARAHGVNANQVFAWRRLYRDGRLGEQKASLKLLAVRVSERLPAPTREKRSVADFAKAQPSSIHIELRQGQMRIEGNPDPVLVRVLLECLTR